MAVSECGYSFFGRRVKLRDSGAEVAKNTAVITRNTAVITRESG
jgi:hypothetical protein